MPGLDEPDNHNNMELENSSDSQENCGNFGNNNAVLPQEQQSGLEYVLEWNKKVSEEQEIRNQCRAQSLYTELPSSEDSATDGIVHSNSAPRVGPVPEYMEDDQFKLQNLSASPRRAFLDFPKTVGEATSAIGVDDERNESMVSVL